MYVYDVYPALPKSENNYKILLEWAETRCAPLLYKIVLFSVCPILSMSLKWISFSLNKSGNGSSIVYELSKYIYTVEPVLRVHLWDKKNLAL